MASVIRSLNGRAFHVGKRLLLNQSLLSFSASQRIIPKIQSNEIKINGNGMTWQLIEQRVNFCSNVRDVEIALYDEVKRISLEDHPKIVMVDVREPEELKETSQIRNSINVPLGVLTENFKISPVDFKNKFNIEKPSFETPLIMICRKGIRAEDAAIQLMSLGYKNVKNYKGSYTDWAEREGLPPPP